jgi:hypothetical protein
VLSQRKGEHKEDAEKGGEDGKGQQVGKEKKKCLIF